MAAINFSGLKLWVLNIVLWQGFLCTSQAATFFILQETGTIDMQLSP
jgi:hypothetical protein